MKITKYKYVKTKQEDFEIVLPEEPFAWQGHNYRVLHVVVPQFTSWLVEHEKKEKEELYSYEIIRICPNEKLIEHTTLSVSANTLEDLLMKEDMKGLGREDHLRLEVLNYIIRWLGEDKVTVETYARSSGVSYEIFKDPITDDGTKKSKKGFLRVDYDEDHEIVCYDQQTKDKIK